MVSGQSVVLDSPLSADYYVWEAENRGNTSAYRVSERHRDASSK